MVHIRYEKNKYRIRYRILFMLIEIFKKKDGLKYL